MSLDSHVGSGGISDLQRKGPLMMADIGPFNIRRFSGVVYAVACSRREILLTRVEFRPASGRQMHQAI